MPHAVSEFDLPSSERIARWGHRAYVGGDDAEAWYGIGRHQYHYLVSEGLRPDHRFLDIACGSLRLGQFLIPYLEPGNYHGLEGEQALVAAGLRDEILFGLAEIKRPRFHFGYDFDFDFAQGFDVAMAQSLFTHLTLVDIEHCFANLARAARADSVFHFTFFEGEGAENPPESHAQKIWRYAFSDLAEIAGRHRWKAAYIGDWGHPRGQMLARAVFLPAT